MTLTIGSLFSGIGGLELGLEWAGLGPTRWQVERDPYCRAVLAKHWPDATRYEDVHHVGRANLVPVDVICGGFPCQDVSNAGRRAGLVEGTRSGLWYELSRIVRELRPRYVVVENVAALLTLGLDAVLGELAASGYDAEWDCVPASAVGAPHRRDRIFVVAYPAGLLRHGGEHHRGRHRQGARSLPESGNGRGAAHVAHTDSERGRSRQTWREDAEDAGQSSRRAGVWSWDVEPDVGRVAHGVPARVDRLRALGNAVVPQVAEVVGRLILAREAERAHREAA